MAHKLSFNGKPIPSDPPTTVSNTGLETYPTGDSTSRGGSRIFFRRGCTRLLLYFNTNKPHSFFLRNTGCIRKPQVISGSGGGVRTPCTLPLDPPLTSLVIHIAISQFVGTLTTHHLACLAGIQR